MVFWFGEKHLDQKAASWGWNWDTSRVNQPNPWPIFHWATWATASRWLMPPSIKPAMCAIPAGLWVVMSAMGPSFHLFFSTTGMRTILRKLLSYIHEGSNLYSSGPNPGINLFNIEWDQMNQPNQATNLPKQSNKHPQIIPSTSMSCPSKKETQFPSNFHHFADPIVHSKTQPADMMALQTITGKQQFWEEPTARNSKRLPQKGKGAVRLRSFHRGGWMRLQTIKHRMNAQGGWMKSCYSPTFHDTLDISYAAMSSWLRSLVWFWGRTPNQWG